MAVAAQERAILVGMDLKSRSRRGADHAPVSTEESLEELGALAESAGARVQETLIQSRPSPDAATLIGSGKLEQLRNSVSFHAADLVLFDLDLTPTQQRNLERELDCKVLDRTQLILDIFARRARTREGQLQVELAQLNYLLPRLTGRGAAMSRLGGGIGTRGPGETQLETDRRRIYGRIKKVTDQLERVRRTRGTQRSQRQAVPLATIALVGYTNAGKSTLFNRLTGANVLSDARMFATLDPTVRHIVLPSRRKVLLSDTVGFIRNLPTTLVKAFRATLEETVQASLLLHVVDASSPHAPHQTAHVLKVLAEIGADKTPQILALNKIDQIGASSAEIIALSQRILGELGGGELGGGELSGREVGGAAVPAEPIPVSARTGAGMDALIQTMDRLLAVDPVSRAKFRIPASEGALIHQLHERAKVLAERYRDGAYEVEAEVPESLRQPLARYSVQ